MKRTRAFSSWGMFLRSRNRQSSGTSVSERSSEPASALVTVQAIGAKMRPSWRCRVKMGMCAAMMMSMEKKVGRPTSTVARSIACEARLLIAGVFQLAQAAEDIFHHDDRAVHDDAKVHRAQGEQVGRDAAPGEADEGGQQRQRDDEGDDGRGAEVAEKEQQHEGDEHGALREVLEDGMEGGINEPGAVVIGDYFDAFGEDGVVEQLNAGLERREHPGWVLAFAHQHDAGNDIVRVVLPHNAFDGQVAQGDIGDVLDQYGRAVVCGDDDALDLIGGAKQADPPDEILLRALGDLAAADVGVAAAERGIKLLQARCRSNASAQAAG